MMDFAAPPPHWLTLPDSQRLSRQISISNRIVVKGSAGRQSNRLATEMVGEKSIAFHPSWRVWPLLFRLGAVRSGAGAAFSRA